MSQSTIVVLGAYGGIGSELCRRLVQSDRKLVATGRDSEKLASLAGELGIQHRQLDGCDFAEVDRMFQQLIDEGHRIGGVVNCIGSLLLKPAHLTSAEEWLEVLTTNLTTSFAALRSAARAMKEGGSVVLISSAAARLGLPNHEAIAAAKAGVIGLALSGAATYASRGIRVNAVAPGLVKTPLTKRIWSSEKSAAASMSLHALHRLGDPADVTSLIEWLLHSENNWITGQVFGVDGGLASVQAKSG